MADDDGMFEVEEWKLRYVIELWMVAGRLLKVMCQGTKVGIR